MRLTRVGMVFTLAALGCLVTCTTPSAEPVPENLWEVVDLGSAWVALPKNWPDMKKIGGPRMLLYRQGSDTPGVPPLDDTGAPLQMGMSVEKFPKEKQSLREVMDALVKGAKSAPQLEMVGQETVEALKLADGTEALLLTVEFIKEKRRRSLQMKLVVKGADNDTWVVSGFLVGGKDSKTPTPGSNRAKWLRAHLTSFTFDKAKLDEGKLPDAYRDRAK
ncbi:hypothetical protein AYO44_09225 [Planctomycetaceae bacterium SCGC AG-212-F19]|nr:hypothetical protein AYO44_09225 [Planctomycetaceae bacterium SCGC AG-212-F19]